MKNPFTSFKSFYAEKNMDNFFRLDGAVPVSKAIPFGIQHVLAMFFSNIVPILVVFAYAYTDTVADAAIISNGLRSAIFFAGLGMVIQLFPIWRIGSRLPVVVGSSFTLMGVASMIGKTYGMSTMFISLIIGGLVIGVLGLFAHKWSKAIKPIVSAIVVLAIGLSLLGTGINDFLSADLVTEGNVYRFDLAWPYLIVSTLTLLTGIIWQIFAKENLKGLSLLVGLGVGYLAALCFIPYNGMVDFSNFKFNSFTDFIDVPRPFFTLMSVKGSDFNIGAILIITIVYIVGITETIGGVSSLTQAGFDREATGREISGAVSAVGFTSAFSSFFGAFPLTMYAQNVGIVKQTKVVNRYAILTGAILLFVASLFPVVTNILLTVPKAVLGGTLLSLFASIAVIGMQMVAGQGFSRKNVLILTLSLGLGYGLTLVPSINSDYYDGGVKYLMLILENPVANMFFISLLLSYIIPERFNDDGSKKKEEDPKNVETAES